MKIPCISVLLILSMIIPFMGNAQDKKSKTDFYQLNFTSLDGREIDFSQFKGKKVLIVNTASKCGFTKQYADLQVLSEKYAGKLVVIGFPSDNFGNQELDSNEAIAQFCQSNYGVTFLMMEKSDVKGKNKNTVFQWLTDKEKNGWNTKEPKWNFGKYLIDEQGNLQEFYPSRVNPISKEVVDGIEKQF